MINFDSALDLMRKYGYSSTSVHPFIYKKGDTIGICYSYVDENYGILERVKFFDNLEIMEEFLKKITWVKANGKANNVRMILDNYETVDPKVLFLRNEKIMVKGEMEDIEGFEARAAAQAKMDEVSKVILQAGNLLLVYDDLKNRQIDYYSSVIKLRNDVRQKYFDLQTMVDNYNGVKKNKEVKLIPNVNDTSGINLMMESSAKDRYNQFRVNHPSMEEALLFVKDVWDLNSNLESNVSYYEKQAEENTIRNDERVVDAKIEYMKDLEKKGKTLFKEDLGKAFRKINCDCKNNSVELSNNFIQEKIANATKKYSYYDSLDIFSISDYLKEAIQNTNYGDLAIKYAKKDPNSIGKDKKIVKLPLNEIASNLTLQYNEKLNDNEKAILTLYNSKYKKLFDLILEIKDFGKKSISDIIKILNDNKDFSKIKSECFDIIAKRLTLPLNASIKNSYFKNIRFENFELFIESIVNELKRMKAINNKMVLNSDLNLYFHIENIDLISSKYFLFLTNDINSVISQVSDNKDLIAISLLKQDVPVLYSPYTLDFGDLYNKDNVEIKVNGMKSFELLVDVSDVLVNVDENLINVVRYYSNPKTVGNVSIVDEIFMNGQNTFCKLALVNNLANKTEAEDSFVENGIVYNGSTSQSISQPVVQQITPVLPVSQPVQPVQQVVPSVTIAQAVVQPNEVQSVLPVEDKPVVSVENPSVVSQSVVDKKLVNNDESKNQEIINNISHTENDVNDISDIVNEEQNSESNVNLENNNEKKVVDNSSVINRKDSNQQSVDNVANMLESIVNNQSNIEKEKKDSAVTDLMNGLQSEINEVSSKGINNDVDFLNTLMNGNVNKNESIVNNESEQDDKDNINIEKNKSNDDIDFLNNLLG